MLTKNHKKLIKSLHQKKYRDLHGLFLVEGEKCVQELLNSDYEIEFLLALETLRSSFSEAEILEEKELKTLSAFKTSPGVLAVAKKRTSAMDSTGDKIILLDNLKDPGNLGTIVRTAEWFGVKDIFLSPECVEEFNPKVVQSTMGSLFRVAIHRCKLPEKITELKDEKFCFYAADMSGENVKNVKWSSKSALVVGSESHGISAEVSSLMDKKITIIGKGEAESLNAAVAASIIINYW